ncbi:RagB/SusD family nutrient uptake outer membrane protein [Pseudochryseolinea flava]|uniref:RagB/SusD family nutrient uptake outer membrane protein n=1 Tax=Pseudochryseolinea flava TaxID=2059302 RepID=A0A364Y5P2_9BACT|nr:RagB/SusD family nutrient uptake outer membrane protein [Pseudochryseolinea flava]RAW02316.1 RagB/SusD family nutrient uptake outer membrane protein [Pseudochryseolinea flava]
MNFLKYSKQSFQRGVVMMFGLFALTACENELDTKVYSELTPSNFYQSEDDFNSAVVALYNPFTSDWGTEDTGDGVYYPSLFNANNRTYLLRSMLTTDEIENGWDANLESFNWGPATWQGTNETVYFKIRYIARATSAIDNMSKSTFVSDAVKNKYIAQAKTLRAWLMYIMYDFFGPVNAKVDPATLTSTVIEPRMDDATYLSQIEKDLVEAMPDLASMYNDDAPNWGRVSQGTARMILLRLYMHTKQWEKAEAVGKEILAMPYELQDNYADIFKNERNKEVIFAVSSSTAAPNWYPQHVFPDNYASSPIIARGGGWYGYSMPWNFFDKFESDDLRRTTTIISSYTNTSGTITDRTNGLRGAIPLKYTGITGPGPSYPDDVVIFRLGEVYLSVAEAINEQRGPSDAYEFVNEIRARAGVDDFEGMTKEQFREAILDERARELYAEGTRRQDLVRHGKFIANAVTRGKDADPGEVLFPIPASVVIQANGIVKQNDGYVD